MTSGNKLPFFHPVSLLATWFGSGLMPFAPGTWGSFAALPFAALIAWQLGPVALLVASLLAYLIGIWASDRYARSLELKDPGAVVIDEVAGQWLTLVPVCLDPLGFLAGFFFFRLFDVLKTWPANVLERRLPGGLGIMSDDMVAGLYGAIATALLMTLFGRDICFPIL
ncbi:MAG: phosphatidylglycerophosphatase A [Limibacillus sp.]|jgi:phosphatidylglycerophosphatase A